MLLFNIVLLLHFTTFLSYVCYLIWHIAKDTKRKDKIGMMMGIVILLTGIALVALKYPAINYYKIVPKTSLFIAVVVINAVYDKKEMTPRVYQILFGLALLAGLIAAVRV